MRVSLWPEVRGPSWLAVDLRVGPLRAGRDVTPEFELFWERLIHSCRSGRERVLLRRLKAIIFRRYYVEVLRDVRDGTEARL